MAQTRQILAESQEFLTRREAADILRVSIRTIANYTKTGVLPSVKLVRKVLIPADAIRIMAQEAME